MGAAEDWQAKAISDLHNSSVTVFNPRRLDWDSSWIQDINQPQFLQQVEWELDHLEAASLILFYFDPNTKSPITLMELGLLAAKKNLVVVCPKGFWRRGNVEIVCRRFDIPFVETLDDGIVAIRLKLEILDGSESTRTE